MNNQFQNSLRLLKMFIPWEFVDGPVPVKAKKTCPSAKFAVSLSSGKGMRTSVEVVLPRIKKRKIFLPGYQKII